MIGSVPTSRRAIAFAQALDEQERDAGAAADTGSEGSADPGRSGAAPPGASPRTRARHAPSRSSASPPSPPSPSGSPPPPHSHRASGTDRPLLPLAGELAALPRPQLDPEVKTVQRAQLIAAMETAFAEGGSAAPDARLPEQRDGRAASRAGRGGAHRAPNPLSKLRPTSRLGKGLAAGGLSVGVAAGALGGAAAASTDALPGDNLYGLKRGMEDLRLDLAGDDADRGSLLLDHASTRMKEARRLMERDRAGALDHESLAEVRRALSGMQHDASEGHRLLSAAYRQDGDLAPIRSLSSFTKEHRDGWSRLRDRLPVQLRDVGEKVTSVFDAMDEDVTPLRSLLPRGPQDGAQERERGTSDRTGEESPSTEPSTPSSDGTHGQRERRSEEPSPTDSQRRDGEGLLGGGLLGPTEKPERGDEPTGSRSGSASGNSATPDGEPEITLPPIVPEVLPGLGLDDREK
ncbi:DUF5667 domain-containing protein [Streptomyces tubbatahanensis]|uniref:DUF5667 domain-containing protein n=1 Tax=Streptomyces tubbatahanensis TaxID=2923272 RepID=A0ABY3XUX1_9ACTN|nr:DUF5667 domain-containing protein [Streptomyces tubbatahanensis]UNS98279.1 DUF5667 domain-containing protein [Streptomyces tubbatahanensis]